MRHGGVNHGGGFNQGGFNHGGHQHGGHQHGGHFVRGVHGGVAGVWWVSGGTWYPWNGYYANGYPYAYAAPNYGGVWYYCQSVGGYYPYVSYCPEGWIPVAPYAY